MMELMSTIISLKEVSLETNGIVLLLVCYLTCLYCSRAFVFPVTARNTALQYNIHSLIIAFCSPLDH